MSDKKFTLFGRTRTITKGETTLGKKTKNVEVRDAEGNLIKAKSKVNGKKGKGKKKKNKKMKLTGDWIGLGIPKLFE